jgi:hypothetical protein
MAATESTNREARLSREAVDLLDCLANGLDNAVFEIAKGIATERQAERIEAEDVRVAADILFRAINQQLAQQNVPASVSHEIQGMYECLKAKCDLLIKPKGKTLPARVR